MPKYLSTLCVTAAYREQALIWHPDRAHDDANEAMIELMVERMADINLAKDVLVEATSDPLWPHSPPQRVANRAPIPHVRAGSSRSAPGGLKAQ